MRLIVTMTGCDAHGDRLASQTLAVEATEERAGILSRRCPSHDECIQSCLFRPDEQDWLCTGCGAEGRLQCLTKR
jgi:hypothetical protein